MTLTQGLQRSAILSRPVPEPWRRPSQGAARGRIDRQFRAHFGREDRAQKLDRTQDRRLRLVANRHLHESAVVAKNLVLTRVRSAEEKDIARIQIIEKRLLRFLFCPWLPQGRLRSIGRQLLRLPADWTAKGCDSPLLMGSPLGLGTGY